MKTRTLILAAIACAIALGTGSGLAAKSPGVLAKKSAPSLKAAGEPNEFDLLTNQLAARKDWNLARLQREALRPEATLLETDANPVDVVWRRTRALLADLQRKKPAPDLKNEAAALEALSPAVESLRAGGFANEAESRRIFDQITVLRRKIAFKNPLLDFNKIVFLKHNMQVRGAFHMVDQYLGFNQKKEGGVFVLENPFGEQPQVKDLLADSKVAKGRLAGRSLTDQGSFISLDLDYDGKTLLFAFTEAEYGVPPGASFANQHITEAELSKSGGFRHYYFRPESAFHLFKVDADGKNLLQLTDSKDNDFDPCFLPNGRIVFISERSGGNERCGSRPLPSATLNAMMPDGSDIIQLSWHDTNEWQPSVDNNGMIVYTRWDYVDRDSDVAHHLWLCYPDGRDPRSFGGNYPDRRESRPWMEMSLRAVPGSHKYIGTAAPHHGNAYGSLIMKDLRIKDDREMSQTRRITPDFQFPEAETAPGVSPARGRPSGIMAFGTPWPLSEDYYLCVYSPEGRRDHGIYLVDSFGNRELLYRDPAIACLDPIPFRPRPRPPVIPTATIQAKADRENAQTPGPAQMAMGTVAVMNVYQGEFPLPKGTKITELRVVDLFPKDNTFIDLPRIGVAAQSLARGVLGTAPVEEDGSVCFNMPTGAGVYFQLLNENGVAVQTMRSDTYLHPGERMTCIGCHEDKHKALNTPPGQVLKALQRAPSTLKPEAEGSYPLTFPRLVQPVLNARCVQCHDEKAPKRSLHGDRFVKNGFSEAFATLSKLAWGMSGGNGTAIKELQYSVPGQVGAQASKLYPMLLAGHHGVKLTREEMRRITTWLDCNSNFYGAYSDADRQAKGEIVAPKWGIPNWTNFESLKH